MSVNKVGVIAASPFDTNMGIEALATKNCNGFAYPATKGGDDFTRFSLLDPQERSDRIIEIIRSAVTDDMDAIMIYCNALSSLIDVEYIQANVPVKVVTPFMVYKKYALMYETLSVICGTNQGLGGIEQAIRGERISDYVIGAGCLKIVRQIEKGIDPEDIFSNLGICELIKFFEACGSECLILGCTHLPYAYDTFCKYSNVPVLDPFIQMYEMLMA